MSTMSFIVPDMSCGHCAETITRAIKGLDDLARVDIDIATKQVSVDSGKDRGEIARRLEEVGYPPQGLTE